ncbi:MAG TPA: MFS transporter [Dehalococcoidia bacterium]|nr:MFS transporter [Dehalococcoidia bacterium]
MVEAARPPIWTRAYVLLCLAVFLSYAQMALLVPTIPLYVVHLGHSAFLAGIVLMSFSLPSFSLRPLVGSLADSWSAAGVLTLGSLLIAAGSSIYMVRAFAAVFVASAARGLGWAGLNTGGYTVLAHLAPAARRGEAAGYYSSLTGAASLAFPAVALWLLSAPHGGYNAVFLAAVLFAILSASIGFIALRPLVSIARVVRRAPAAGLLSAAVGLIDRGVLLATALNASVTLSQPAITAFLPLYARHLGIQGVGLFYVVAGASDILSRPLFGRAGDRVGRGYSMLPSYLAQIAGVALILFWPSLQTILVCGVLNGAGSAVNSASAMALGMDLADPRRRGAAMATFSLSFQMGSGIGSLMAGSLITFVGFQGMYAGSIAVLTCGLGLALANWRRLAGVIPVAV